MKHTYLLPVLLVLFSCAKAGKMPGPMPYPNTSPVSAPKAPQAPQANTTEVDCSSPNVPVSCKIVSGVTLTAQVIVESKQDDDVVEVTENQYDDKRSASGKECKVGVLSGQQFKYHKNKETKEVTTVTTTIDDKPVTFYPDLLKNKDQKVKEYYNVSAEPDANPFLEYRLVRDKKLLTLTLKCSYK